MSDSGKPHRIQLSRKRGYRMPPNTAKVDRSTKWGNPFVPGKVGPMGGSPIDKEGAVGLFRAMLRDPEILAAAGYPSDNEIRAELSGKNLGCWCEANEFCHADVLMEIANSQRGHNDPHPPEAAISRWTPRHTM